MTKAQYKVFNRLRKKQTNRSDVALVETSTTSCTIFVTFPGLYLTYDNAGKLIETQTVIEREAAGHALTKPGGNIQLQGEMGSDDYGGMFNRIPVIDDDVPF